MSIWITGDIHGFQNINKLSARWWPEGKNLTKSDYVIICGDFGLLWCNSPDREEIYWLKWLGDKPFTTLFVEGNHENYRRLRCLPAVPMFGAQVGKVNNSVFHLRRGEIYTIEGKTFFTMGGATSVDKEGRIEGISWWREEIPSYAEFDYGFQNLERHGNKVDYIIAHTLPIAVKDILYDDLKPGRCPASVGLQEICNRVEFKKYYCGHFHDDRSIDKFTILYRTIQRIED